MDQQLKERLVGAAVLALLAVLFVPMILDGPDDAPTTRDIPLPPAIPSPSRPIILICKPASRPRR